MDLSIVVVNWNTHDLLEQCLESVERTVRGLEYEVLVVDNGSADGSADLVERRFPTVRLIRNPDNVGFARANNQAIAASAGRHLLLLNSDAVLLDDTARAMVELLERRPEVGVVGGRLLNPDGSFQHSYCDFPNLFGELLLLTALSRWVLPSTYPSYPEARSREPREADWVSGALLLARRAAVEQVGPLDEDYFMYSEEMDWCYRMKRAGWRVYYLPDARAIHWGGGTSRRIPRPKRAQLYRSKWLFLSKHYSPLEAGAYRLLVRAISLLKLLAWAASGALPIAGRREQARQQVASYRFLLGTF